MACLCFAATHSLVATQQQAPRSRSNICKRRLDLAAEQRHNYAHKAVGLSYTPQQSQTDSADRQRRAAAALEMETTQLLLIAAAVAAACGALFVAWAATSDSREARVYRRKWKEFRLKNSKRNTSKYRGVGAGGGMHAASGLRSTCEVRHRRGAPRRRERARQARRLVSRT